MKRLLSLTVSALLVCVAVSAFAVDAVPTPANVIQGPSAVTNYGILGGTVERGDVVVVDSTGIRRADNLLSAATARPVGIAIDGGVAGNSIAYVTVDPAFTPGFVVTAGTVYVLSVNGLMSPAADATTGDYMAIIGVGTTGNKLVLRPFSWGVKR